MGKKRLAILSTYTARINGSVGSKEYRKCFFLIDGKPLDVLFNGDVACAFYVSSILFSLGLIGEIHTKVKTTRADMMASGWYEIPEPREGAVIEWGCKNLEGGKRSRHHHVGFWMSPRWAISSDSSKKRIARHHPNCGKLADGSPIREAVAYYWHDNLNDDP